MGLQHCNICPKKKNSVFVDGFFTGVIKFGDTVRAVRWAPTKFRTTRKRVLKTVFPKTSRFCTTSCKSYVRSRPLKKGQHRSLLRYLPHNNLFPSTHGFAMWGVHGPLMVTQHNGRSCLRRSKTSMVKVFANLPQNAPTHPSLASFYSELLQIGADRVTFSKVPSNLALMLSQNENVGVLQHGRNTSINPRSTLCFAFLPSMVWLRSSWELALGETWSNLKVPS